jgi:NAD-dependent dihydropyrimidine dehydrogenase PreA subunit
MAVKNTRKIVKIDEEKCNGCGVCTSACAEGALALIDGKARLVSETYCDGLAACLGECPQGAISIEEREAEAFDEHAVEKHLATGKAHRQETPCACPGSAVRRLDVPQKKDNISPGTRKEESMLSHWPVQMTLVPPRAPFLTGADVALIADCVPFAYADFHRDFIRDHVVLVACPKLDDFEAHLEKLTDILQQSEIQSLTVVHMEVPCCSGLVKMAREAIRASGKNIPFQEITVGIRGELKE